MTFHPKKQSTHFMQEKVAKNNFYTDKSWIKDKKGVEVGKNTFVLSQIFQPVYHNLVLAQNNQTYVHTVKPSFSVKNDQINIALKSSLTVIVWQYIFNSMLSTY